MASANEIVLPKNFDIAKLSFSQPKQLTTGGKTIFVNYSGNQLLMQTPDMKTPFGVSVWPGDNGGPDKYSLDLSFDGFESREPVRQFLDVVNVIDDRMINDAMENSQLWFKKKYPSKEVVVELYTKSLRHSKDRETGEVNTRYAPTLKMALPIKDGRFQFPTYGDRRNELDLFEMVQSGSSKGARCRAIVHLSGVWIVGTKFGLSWKVKQLQVCMNSKSLSKWAFQKTEEDASDEEPEESEVASVGAPKTASTSKKAEGVMIAESDDENDDLEP